MKLNIDAHLWCLGSYAERYVPGGYYEDMPLERKLEIFKKIQGLTGISIFVPTDPMPSEVTKLQKLLKEYGLKVSFIEPETWSDRKWKNGAFSTNEAHVRKDAVKRLKESIDLAVEMKADSVLLWPAHDGFDYPFQADYRDGWKYLVDTVREIGEYNKNVKIAVEYKYKDPRQKQYISDIGKEMMFLNDVGLPNVGGVIDVGHALMSGENLAESTVILDSHEKLFQVHLNDNYKDADPDMIIGTINFWEILEFFYYLNKTNYSGWCSIDIIAARDDREKSLELAVKMTLTYKELADRLSKKRKEIDENLKGYRFADNMNLIMELLFK